MSKNNGIKHINEVSFFHPLEKLNTAANRKECLFKLSKKKEAVQLNLDNCVIQKMEELYHRSKQPIIDDVKQLGLFPLVDLLNAFPKAPILMTPIGVLEMPNRYHKGAKGAFERFCQQFWSTSTDDPKGTQLEKTEGADIKLEFQYFTPLAKQMYGMSYLPFLLIQEILCCHSEETAMQKLERYVYGVIHYLDMISGFELEIAKYAFWELTEQEVHELPETLRERRQNLKRNFYKKQNALEKCKAFSLNAAMDKFWLNPIYVNHQHPEKLDYGYTVTQHWFVTLDQKLYKTANDITSLLSPSGSYGHAIAVVRENEMRTSDYWKAADKFTDNLLKERKLSNINALEKKLGSIERSVIEINKSLEKYFLR